MSEEAQKPADPAASPAKVVAKPAGPAPFVLIGVIVGALLAGVAAGSLLIAPRVIHARQAGAVAGKDDKKAKKDKKKGKEGEGKPTIYKIDNIIVNPAGSQGGRFLMCSIAIEPEDEKLVDVLREHEVELRDKVVTTLTSVTLEQLTSPGARDTLRSRLIVTIHSVLDKSDQSEPIKVYLPQFVIQ